MERWQATAIASQLGSLQAVGRAIVSDSFNMDSTVGEPILPLDVPPSSASYDLYVGSRYTIFIPLSVGIDIKPGRGPNSIHLKKNSTVAVAILSSDHFDATSIHPETVRFGRCFS